MHPITEAKFLSLSEPYQHDYILIWINNLKLCGRYNYRKWRSMKQCLENCIPNEYLAFSRWLGMILN